ncbi:MAG TPA: division/cell wall cluster transcriptional repressor MraZ [Armatimonadota bacterium]|nr:division/cell wall cluster transcriptional repressor MraZ [Armatimonadota bacterium]
MFSGAFVHRVDEKGRLMIPPRFRASLGESFNITRGMGGCLWIFPADEWAEVVRKLEPKSLVDRSALALQRYFLGAASDGALDPQGRLAIPPVLRDHAAILHEVMVMGAGTRLEIWSRERWEQFDAELTEDRLEQMGLEVGL